MGWQAASMIVMKSMKLVYKRRIRWVNIRLSLYEMNCYTLPCTYAHDWYKSADWMTRQSCLECLGLECLAMHARGIAPKDIPRRCDSNAERVGANGHRRPTH